MNEAKPIINIDDFERVDIRVGEILACENVEKSEKLLKLDVDFGPLGRRQILTGLAMWYKPADFIGKKVAFIVNLAPRKMMGLESQGMILGVGLSNDKKPSLLLPLENVENGEGVR